MCLSVSSLLLLPREFLPALADIRHQGVVSGSQVLNACLCRLSLWEASLKAAFGYSVMLFDLLNFFGVKATLFATALLFVPVG